jgi:heme exporter protein CcmD
MNFDMGVYAVYIWPAYGVSAVGLIGATLWTVLAWRRAKARLAALELASAPKRGTSRP